MSARLLFKFGGGIPAVFFCARIFLILHTVCAMIITAVSMGPYPYPPPCAASLPRRICRPRTVPFRSPLRRPRSGEPRDAGVRRSCGAGPVRSGQAAARETACSAWTKAKSTVGRICQRVECAKHIKSSAEVKQWRKSFWSFPSTPLLRKT